jgi:hypothetical protein
MMMKPLAAGLLSVAALAATPAMAQVIVQEPGLVTYGYADAPYYPAGYGYRFTAGPGYYYGGRISPAPRVGAFATAPWVDDTYGYYGYAAPY